MVIRPRGSRAKFNTCGYFHIDLACAGLVLRSEASRRILGEPLHSKKPRNLDAVTGELQEHPAARRRGRPLRCLSSLSSCHEVAAAAATTTTTTVSSVMMSLSKSKLARETDESTTDRQRARVRSHRLDSARTGGSNYCSKGGRGERRKSPLNNRTDDDARRDYCYNLYNFIIIIIILYNL